MELKKTYYPSRIFDDVLEALVLLFVTKGWSFPGIDLAQLEEDVAAQRCQRAEHDAKQREYLALHETFGLEQEARYRRFAKALNAARGVFCTDKAVMAELDMFKRACSRARRSKDEEEAS